MDRRRRPPTSMAVLLITATPLGARARAADLALPPVVEAALERAGKNRAELVSALSRAPEKERPGIEFLLAHMPERDLRTLPADFLLENSRCAHRAVEEVPWGASIPPEVFLTHRVIGPLRTGRRVFPSGFSSG